jgi:hypothetical protein
VTFSYLKTPVDKRQVTLGEGRLAGRLDGVGTQKRMRGPQDGSTWEASSCAVTGQLVALEHWQFRQRTSGTIIAGYCMYVCMLDLFIYLRVELFGGQRRRGDLRASTLKLSIWAIRAVAGSRPHRVKFLLEFQPAKPLTPRLALAQAEMFRKLLTARLGRGSLEELHKRPSNRVNLVFRRLQRERKLPNRLEPR